MTRQSEVKAGQSLSISAPSRQVSWVSQSLSPARPASEIQKPEPYPPVPWSFPQRSKQTVSNPQPCQANVDGGLISGLIPKTCNRPECRCKTAVSQTKPKPDKVKITVNTAAFNHSTISTPLSKPSVNTKTAAEANITPSPINPLETPCIDQCPIPGHLRDIVLQDVWDTGKVGSFVNHGYVAKGSKDAALTRAYKKAAGTATNLEVVKFCRPPTPVSISPSSSPSSELLDTIHRRKNLFQSSSSSSSLSKPGRNNTKRGSRTRKIRPKLDHNTVEQRLLLTRRKAACRKYLPATVDLHITEHEVPATTNLAHEYSAALAWWYDTVDGVAVNKRIPQADLPVADMYQYD
ncbi:hypothetical protein PV10_02869 [Exophiala mesophila]|uniref:Uncharacterized protein n=1 Tax=Exophiala mesophila TaxID=212818 RepID=A0A0D1ZMI6_EXOME|nr:uncharacterized protein PV10_02869 [Exophiala mesophila]KIV95189.1 hypothetical protein PV10_02869 [Exophiala mesophila]